MALRIPTSKDLERLAEANHFQLNEQELEAFQALIPGMFESYEVLDQMREPKEPLKYRGRDPGQRPTRQEDPLNAIVRRCTLKGASWGKLAGKRFGLKNNINVAGMPMGLGSLVLGEYVPDTDATIVTWLLDAGAEIVATLNLENFAFSGGGDTSALGPVLNPHNPEHLAGGSSGGSGAALYYDDIDITIGGDQGGSIRVPASWCGVVGLKPTYSLVPYTGIAGIDATFDHAGPMARTVEGRRPDPGSNRWEGPHGPASRGSSGPSLHPSLGERGQWPPHRCIERGVWIRRLPTRGGRGGAAGCGRAE